MSTKSFPLIVIRKVCYVVMLVAVQLTTPCRTYRLDDRRLFLGWPHSRKRAPPRSCPRVNMLNEKCNCKELDKKYDVIVIGGGHSGCEASHISAKLRAKTLLITQCKDSIGEMSCNPSIGGIGKGILVKEIDALGGLMGKAIDKSGIHFKILNIRKGLAVRGHRAQADRDLYNYHMKEYMHDTKNLHILESTVQSLLIENCTSGDSPLSGRRVYGVKNKCACEFYANSVVLTTGTFLGGVCHIGKEKYHGGRIKRISRGMHWKRGVQNGEMSPTGISTVGVSPPHECSIAKCIPPHSDGIVYTTHDKLQKESKTIFDQLVESSTQSISNQLREHRFEIKRMKTGTPPRLHISSIDFTSLEREDSERENPFYFSFLNSNKINKNKTLPCYKTYTNERTHELVRTHLNELPDFDCYDKLGNGPRYCPSIAKKVTKFSEKNKHVIWLEPEGFHNVLIYPNGLSSAFPINTQKEIVNSIRGLENAEIVFPAYDVEYYYVNPKCLNYTLETKNIKGLFLAGQICGTTGYEEAACQGIVAGINAAINSRSNDEERKEQLILKRSESYIGVLIHDLINKGITEPYRMFTSRAEYRLYLRPDNCDIRLTPIAHKLGIVSDERMYILRQKYASVNRLIFLFKKLQLSSSYEGEKKNSSDSCGTDAEHIFVKNSVEAFQTDAKKNAHLEFTSRKGNINTLYTIFRSGVEYPLHILLKKIQEVQGWNELQSSLLPEQNNIAIYMDKMKHCGLSLDENYDLLLNCATLETACAEVKYSPYLTKQIREVDKIRDSFDLVIPPDVTYDRLNFPYLSNEEIEKLNKFRPRTLHDANRIEGVTMSAIYYLYYYIKGEKNKVKR
ncbi:glucose inhibited division protein a homologue, putative [Plasmodium knowlesi strain H]|uniref:Glucose inhibited division protein a homologue, putative n=3 Tax=Plasmodium knowlesi TaxID=5850 RepID=A0A5K1UI01_PLAKH|nr:Glucose inhibited division protein A-like [Plasmodium knowlesi strain H]OTN64085.1 putative Glucose inhibited division protein A-like protein [Plasmodium knowlesi]CAA9991230.1 glucose inhibited division protein a homologue, putative [Plasmodium knowlesi strain H]SBO26302.1 glucose inhibited division protein a homologue, putative [Plasmodium knowlesi strain H]SBO29569.1 glucose inhibited division protein a homologue, putative [Plasmodium knowlesi strain H]VVS80704.1 glucose inhibited divisio|eukprot:XP_002262512.1 Glucose inhibited division protein A-like [Plasmodium knowlesi strain H]